MAPLAQVNLRFPAHVVDELDGLAAAAGLTRSRLVARMIRSARRQADAERDLAIVTELATRGDPVYPDLNAAGAAQMAAMPDLPAR